MSLIPHGQRFIPAYMWKPLQPINHHYSRLVNLDWSFAVVYHALNGLRIIVFDYKPEWWKYQQKAAIWVLVATVIILVPVYSLAWSDTLSTTILVIRDPFILPIGTVSSLIRHHLL